MSSSTVNIVNSPNLSGIYTINNKITITILFTKQIIVDTSNGVPTLLLNTIPQQEAVYTSVLGQIMNFEYNIQNGDTTNNEYLDYVNTITLNNSTIKDVEGNDVDLSSMPLPGSDTSLKGNRQIIIDTIFPTVVTVSSSNENKTYSINEIIYIKVQFSKVVLVTGTPMLLLNIGNTDNGGYYFSGSNSNELIFKYNVQCQDTTSGLFLDLIAGVNPILLENSTIVDLAGNSIDQTTISAPGEPNSLSENSEIIIHIIPPTITKIYSSNDNGYYKESDIIDIRVEFSEVVLVENGNPSLRLNTKSKNRITRPSCAFLNSQNNGNGTNTLIFNYIVKAKDTTYDISLDCAKQPFLLNNSTIKNISGVNAILTTPEIGTFGSLSYNNHIIIDTTPPKIVNIYSSNENGYYNINDVIYIHVEFSKIVKVTGSHILRLNHSNSHYESGSETNTLIFKYIVQAGDMSSKLDCILPFISTGTIMDLIGNPLNQNRYIAHSAEHSLSRNNNIIIDTNKPLLLSSIPSFDAINVYTDNKIILTFVDPVILHSGSILLLKNDILLETIEYNSTQISGNNTSQITITLENNFLLSSEYTVKIDNTIFKNNNNDFYKGISFRFTTYNMIDSPLLSENIYGENNEIVITFLDTVTVHSGNIRLLLNDSIIEIIDTSSSQVTGTNTSQITITLKNYLILSTTYTIEFDNTIFKNSNNMFYESITCNFVSSGNTNLPKILLTSTNPINNSIYLQSDNSIILSFSEVVYTKSGYIKIYKEDNTLVESIDVIGNNIVGSGSSTITIQPSNLFEGSTCYYVQIDSTAFHNIIGIFYEGIADTTSFMFKIKPLIMSTDPSNQATRVAINNDILFTFSQPINIKNGTVVVYTSDNDIVENIDITSNQVSGSGTDKIKINLMNYLTKNTCYFVEIDAIYVCNNTEFNEKKKIQFKTINQLPSSLILPWKQNDNEIYKETENIETDLVVSVNNDGTIIATSSIESVNIYKWNNNTWEQLGKSIINETTDGQNIHSISLNSSGNIVAIGRIDLNTNIGKVRVYKWNNLTWNQIGGNGELNSKINNDSFGYSLSLSNNGETLAIGAIYDDTNTGKVYVYKWNNNTWKQLGNYILGKKIGDRFGWSISLNKSNESNIDGTVIAVGAPMNDESLGNVSIYKYLNDSWIQVTSIFGDISGDQCGHSVSLNNDGSVIAIGYPSIYNNTTNPGHVCIYENKNNLWEKNVTILGDSNGKQFGYSVALSNDGKIVAIGEPFRNNGHISIYEYKETTETDWNDSSKVIKQDNSAWEENSLYWNLIENDISGKTTNEFCGKSFSLSDNGNTIVVGIQSNYLENTRVYVSQDNSIIAISNTIEAIKKFMSNPNVSTFSDFVASTSGEDSRILTLMDYKEILHTFMNTNE